MMHGCGELGPIVAHLVEMKLLIICMALGMSGICQAGVPKLLTERAFTSASLAEAANHFITIGEQATFKELKIAERALAQEIGKPRRRQRRKMRIRQVGQGECRHHMLPAGRYAGLSHGTVIS